jgi:hypothetical protein
VQADLIVGNLEAMRGMLHFHISALLASTPEDLVPSVLLHIRCFARAARHLVPRSNAGEEDPGAGPRLAFIADLTELVAAEVAGPSTCHAAAKLPRPSSAYPLQLAELQSFSSHSPCSVWETFLHGDLFCHAACIQYPVEFNFMHS